MYIYLYKTRYIFQLSQVLISVYGTAILIYGEKQFRCFGFTSVF